MRTALASTRVKLTRCPCPNPSPIKRCLLMSVVQRDQSQIAAADFRLSRLCYQNPCILLTVSLRDTDYQTQSEKINEDSLIYMRDTDYHYEDQYYYESCNDEKRLTTQSEKINEDWVM